jgi:hypothetical protein
MTINSKNPLQRYWNNKVPVYISFAANALFSVLRRFGSAQALDALNVLLAVAENSDPSNQRSADDWRVEYKKALQAHQVSEIMKEGILGVYDSLISHTSKKAGEYKHIKAYRDSIMRACCSSYFKLACEAVSAKITVYEEARINQTLLNCEGILSQSERLVERFENEILRILRRVPLEVRSAFLKQVEGIVLHALQSELQEMLVPDNDRTGIYPAIIDGQHAEDYQRLVKKTCKLSVAVLEMRGVRRKLRRSPELLKLFMVMFPKKISSIVWGILPTMTNKGDHDDLIKYAQQQVEAINDPSRREGSNG